MARQTRSESCFFRHVAAEETIVYLRINPQAVRFSQGGKRMVTETLGGYFRDVMYSDRPQSNGLLLPDLTIEATTGVAYRTELKRIKWLWEKSGQRKPDGSPADLYFYNLQEFGAYQGIERDEQHAWLIDLQQFAWDESVQSPHEIKMTMRCKILEDLFGDLDFDPVAVATGELPTLNEFETDPDLTQFSSPIADISGATFSTQELPL